MVSYHITYVSYQAIKPTNLINSGRKRKNLLNIGKKRARDPQRLVSNCESIC